MVGLMTADILERYRRFVDRGCEYQRTNTRDRLSLAGHGIGGEGGEVIDLIKKHLHHGKRLDREAFVLELGDLFWYFTLLCDTLNIDIGEVIRGNVDKLLERYPERHPDGY